ncbi:hypothetical protein Molly5_193 [Maribacter phage Molly_5]|uniref:Uncharacterized protein n=1 Tax=Maribacter phage Molly_1 TaxID=2745685 RepID=A0A8E4UYA9_9CAUD|nr:hypothetical protein M1M29_gp193 [Maribacter phage Molly_1]QQO97692.1 hypothetical protein Molly2_193 [Maribacter phage Molly_2]QQO97892.1 hypothetical protein Molly3_193 [Maribacter phage Molly_3]QQO98092.1 hypothetical protein Molly4_193 [Maribacter phage Molly_4]QQO98292.1 hypothetical protein Molly5_193 [Maribacter phage Molly_5]QQO97492.1 hypothetical protein Molly1_193 [Maribacter phage Molly_1]
MAPIVSEVSKAEFGGLIRADFKKAYPHIEVFQLSLDWFTETYEKWSKGDRTDDHIFNLMQDEIMSQGLCDYQE